MRILVNGEHAEVSEGLTVSGLLAKRDVGMPDTVSVELNGKILPRPDYDLTRLKEDDEVELMYFMGGGPAASD